MRYSISCGLVAVALAQVALSSPAAAPQPTTPTKVKRDIFDEASSVIASLGSSIPTIVTQGVLPELQDLPSDADVIKQFNLTDADIAALPINVLNIPGYANYTENGWLLYMHGQAYKTPLTNGSKLDDAANKFIPKLDISQLTLEEQNNARNLTAAIYSLPVEGVELIFDISTSSKDVYTVQFPNKTDSRGEFGRFIPLDSTQLPMTTKVQRLDVHVNGTSTGNASAYFVPTEGITVVSDIDDILRVTRIYQPEQGLNNTFVNDFVPWENMPAIYNNWNKTNPGIHFHYLTTTPEPGTRVYEQFIYADYPLGSFDTRPYNFTTSDQLLQIRLVNLNRVLETFPKRKFVLIADTSNADVMRDYPAVAKAFPGQVQCILLRNTTATDSGDEFPYNTAGFEGLDNSTYMFFRNSDDLVGLNFTNGDCRNTTFAQNVTYSYQGLPSLKKSAASSTSSSLLQMSLLGVISSMWLLL